MTAPRRRAPRKPAFFNGPSGPFPGRPESIPAGRLRFPFLLAATLASVASGPGAAAAETAGTDPQERIRALEKRVEQLEKLLERQLNQSPAATTGAAARPGLEASHDPSTSESEAVGKRGASLSVGSSGVAFRSGDTNGNFSFRLGGTIQIDSRWYPDDGGIDDNDGFVLRRVRPSLDGRFYRDLEFEITPELSSAQAEIRDAWIRYTVLDELTFTLGKFKPPGSLERHQSVANAPMIERSVTTDLWPDRDIGLQIGGVLWRGADEAIASLSHPGLLEYAAAVVNGTGDDRTAEHRDFDGHPEVAARLFTHPFLRSGLTPVQGIGLGVAWTYGEKEGTDGLPDEVAYFSEGQQELFTYHNGNGNGPGSPDVKADGVHWRLGPQAYWYLGPFGLLGEYAMSNQELRREAGTISRGRVEHTAWGLTASWLLTGESASFRRVVPRDPFRPRAGGLGAWQVVARYSVLDLDDDAFPRFADPADSATRATAWGVGINWFLNRNLRASLNYLQTDFRGGQAGEVSGQTEHAILTRAQLAF